MDLRVTAADLFAGAGGLSIGFTRAGIEVVAAFESWPIAVETYRTNIGPHAQLTIIDEDTELPDVDVVAGGPPCQGFSSAGLRRENDERNTLVGVFARLVARRRPRAFVFENVEGFLTGANGAHVFELLEPLVGAGYRIHLRKVNAANYGVPQHRKRVIAIGALGWNPTFPEPTHNAYGAPGAHVASRSGLPRTPTLDEALANLPVAAMTSSDGKGDHVCIPLKDVDLRRAELLAPGQTMRDLPQELWHGSYRKRAFRRVMDGTPSERRGGAPSGLRRLKGDEPSKAITGGALRDFLHPTAHRPLTVKECATLQTFPQDFQFFGRQSERVQLIGNAVPARLGEVIGRSIRRDILSTPWESPALPGALLSFVPTLADGMSPALLAVTQRIMSDFGSNALEGYSADLWR